MRGVSGDENAALRVMLRAEQMLRPLVHGKHFELDRHPQRPPENFRHFAVARRGGMQSPVARAVLEDDEREYGSLSDVVVAALPHRNAVVEFRAVEKRLAELSNVAFALQLNAQLLSNGAGASVASNQVHCSNGLVWAIARSHVRCYGIAILRERRQFAAEAHFHIRERLYNRSEQRFERVLRDQLIRLERPSIVVSRDFG